MCEHIHFKDGKTEAQRIRQQDSETLPWFLLLSAVPDWCERVCCHVHVFVSIHCIGFSVCMCVCVAAVVLGCMLCVCVVVCPCVTCMCVGMCVSVCGVNELLHLKSWA